MLRGCMCHMDTTYKNQSCKVNQTKPAYTINQLPIHSIASATSISSSEWVHAMYLSVRRRLVGLASSAWLYWLISDSVVISITLWQA